ncbi:hypothetical protein MKZ38_002587 [Zalerion maritima]|uniref:Uncharacterized protein n=1 Tax=Zalerion maritima TaxID=339359 RepID=A0AAD5WSB7_9PEZI|nr:hypothetical protein MKZ38_002587 [Zalerion maritima]
MAATGKTEPAGPNNPGSRFFTNLQTDLEAVASTLDLPNSAGEMKKAAMKANALSFFAILGRLAPPSEEVTQSIADLFEPVSALLNRSLDRLLLLPLLSTTDGCRFLALLWTLRSASTSVSYARTVLKGMLESVSLDLAEKTSWLMDIAPLESVCNALRTHGQQVHLIKNFRPAFEGFTNWLHHRYPTLVGDNHKSATTETGGDHKLCLPTGRTLAQHLLYISRFQVLDTPFSTRTPLVVLGVPALSFLATYASLFMRLPSALHDQRDIDGKHQIYELGLPDDHLATKTRRHPFFWIAGKYWSHLKTSVLFFPDFDTREQLLDDVQRPERGYKFSIPEKTEAFLELGMCPHFDGSWAAANIVLLPDREDFESEDEAKKFQGGIFRELENSGVGSGENVNIPGWDDAGVYFEMSEDKYARTNQSADRSNN